MPDLSKTPLQIKFKRGLRANVDKAAASYLGIQGEPAYTTDDKHLWVHDGSVFQPVPALDMAVVHSGDIVTSGGEIVWRV